jgi:hypothetical protein
LGCSLVFTLIIQCFIVLKLIVFKGNIRTKSGPVDQLYFLPDDVILKKFCVQFIKKLSNRLIDIHLIVPPNYIWILSKKKSKSYCQVNFEVLPVKRSIEFLNWSQKDLDKIWTRQSTSFFT